MAVNCGGVVATLAESLLFGHEKGSFTGAFAAAPGVFRSAEGGTVFLDEIGDLPREAQPKLLRVLQRGEVTPLGSAANHHVDVVVIAATNRPLEGDVAAGLFREDLFYRLNTIHLRVPPLRSRPEDVPRFIGHFSTHFAQLYGRPPWRPAPAVVARLMTHSWPGNIRQLAQTVQRVYVFEDRVDAVLEELFAPEAKALLPAPAEPPRPAPPVAVHRGLAAGPIVGLTLPVAAHEAVPAEQQVPVFNLDELRRLAVRQALALTGGHRGQAARLLGVTPNRMTRLAAEACPDLSPHTGRPRQARPKPR